MNFLSVPVVFLTFLLFSCNSDDSIIADIPETIDVPEELHFKTVFPLDLVASCCYQPALGFVANEASDKLYFAKWEDAANDNFMERVGAIDFSDSNNSTSVERADAWENERKRIEIIDSEIVVISSRSINVYDVDLNFLRFHWHDELWRAFDMSSDDGSIWGIGSRHFEDPNSFTIYNWDNTSSNFVRHKIVNEERDGAATELIDNTLYIFGGIKDKYAGEAHNTGLIYNTLTKEFDAPVVMPFDLARPVSTKYEHLIFVAGWTVQDGVFTDIRDYLAVYNTLDGTFTEIEYTLENQMDNRKMISGMTILNDKLYIATVTANQEAEVQVVNLK